MKIPVCHRADFLVGVSLCQDCFVKNWTSAKKMPFITRTKTVFVYFMIYFQGNDNSINRNVLVKDRQDILFAVSNRARIFT